MLNLTRVKTFSPTCEKFFCTESEFRDEAHKRKYEQMLEDLIWNNIEQLESLKKTINSLNRKVEISVGVTVFDEESRLKDIKEETIIKKYEQDKVLSKGIAISSVEEIKKELKTLANEGIIIWENIESYKQSQLEKIKKVGEFVSMWNSNLDEKFIHSEIGTNIYVEVIKSILEL